MEIKEKDFALIFYCIAGVLFVSLVATMFAPLSEQQFDFGKTCFNWATGAIATLFLSSKSRRDDDSGEDVPRTATRREGEGSLEESSNG